MRQFWISLLLAPFAFAQEPSISGIIVDPSSRPVPDAVVRCGSAESRTSADGRFTVAATAGCDAVVEAAGFDTKHVALEPGREARISLGIATMNESVVVSATRAPIAIEESGVSASVFTGADVAARQYPPVLDLLRDVPGETVVQTGRRGAITSLFTRGAPSTGTLVLLDGIPLNEPGGQLNLAHLSSAGIGRVEVVRGPESALFGAEAAAGVVQLFTEQGDPESRRPHGSVSYDRGSFSSDRWIANLNGGAFDRLDYSLTADQYHMAGEYQNDFYRNTTGTANVGYRLGGSTQLRAVFRELDAIAGNPDQVGWGVYNLDAFGSDRNSAVSIKLDDARGSRYYQRLSYNYSRLRDRYTDINMEGPYDVAALVREVADPTPRVYLDRVVPFNYAGPIPAGERLVQNSVTEYPFEGLTISDRKALDYQGTLAHAGGSLVFGYEFERQSGLISGATPTRDNNGVFVHEQYRIGRRLALTGGLRAEHSSTFGSKIAPRGSATVLLFGSTYLRASAGRGITEPSLLQNFSRESYYVGNPNLRPEKIDTYEAAVTQELFNRRIRAEVAYFRNYFKDLIVYDFSVYPGTSVNVDRSWARGVETSVSARMWKHSSLTGSWTRLNTRITTTNAFGVYAGVGQELPRRPRNSGSIVLQIAPKRWTLVAGGRFVGERQDADYVFNVTRSPSYASAFASASVQLTKHLAPYVRVDNMTDERYSEALGYPAQSRYAAGGVRVNW